MLVMEDIIRACMNIKPQKTYLIDMPRGMRKNHLAGFFSGIESLKNGCMHDKRYAVKKRRIDRPKVVVFNNSIPDLSLMSSDRWEMYSVLPSRELGPPLPPLPFPFFLKQLNV